MPFICKHCNKEYSTQSSRSNHIKIYHKKEYEENKKFICDKCNKNFCNLELIKEHCINDCRPSIKSNNIYTFKTDTLGKIKYKDFNGGDIYIIQTEFQLKGFYKIGITTDLYKRLGQYRCGSVLEPKLHYYYPCKNIKKIDKILKDKLQNFNVKREIYKADSIDDLRNAIKEVQKESDSLDLEIIPESKECEITGCPYCDIYFTNKQDLDLHKNKNHPIEFKLEINKDKEEIVIKAKKSKKKYNFDINNEKDINCKKCNKIFTNRQTRWRHEKECNNKKITIDDYDIKVQKLEKKTETLEKELEKIKKLFYEKLDNLDIFD